MTISTISIGAAVTPTIVKTTFSHYTNRKPRARKPTAHISYDQGLHLIKSFLLYVSHHTVEDVQSFTGQWVPHPTWTRVENVPISESSISQAAELLRAQLGEEGLAAVGGTKWWLWRRRDAELKAEWVELRSHYNERQKNGSKCRRVMLYVHGGAYFFGSVDEHRYQLQRHARKLKARVFAPRYRLAPQFPFPCGLLDCLAAYMYLLTLHDPSEIVFAGDSAGGGMILSILCLLRDRSIPLPAGAILISPWVDLTHSFPSLGREDELDYIPAHGFMQKPSASWPPPTSDELRELLKAAGTTILPQSKDQTDTPTTPYRVDTLEAENTSRQIQPPLSLQLDGQEVIIKDQIQLYTTNQLISHPLVSPALQPSLGGLPPLLVVAGGGELLRDEQIFIAHKAADPQRYKLSAHWRKLYDPDDVTLDKYGPTPVQLQVWEDLCHVAPTLSFTRPAKFMYRSVAQFGAWALSRAQNRGIEIQVANDTSDSASDTDSDSHSDISIRNKGLKPVREKPTTAPFEVGRAGDPLPAFERHMIRQQVDRHGVCFALPDATDLPALQMSADLVGVVKEGPIRKWLKAKSEWDTRYASVRRKIHRKRLDTIVNGKARTFGEGEQPPPSALAGRLHDADTYTRTQKLKKSWGLGMWSSWGSKHDGKTLENDEKAEKQEEKDDIRSRSRDASQSHNQKIGADGSASPRLEPIESRAKAGSRAVVVQNEGQVEGHAPVLSPAPAAGLSQHAETVPVLTISCSDGDIPKKSLSPYDQPRCKTVNQLRDEHGGVSEIGSIHSNASHIMSDNASTKAVFSAAGVSRLNHDDDDDDDDGNKSILGGGTKQFDPARNPIPICKDNLGGYDTPHSRRSVERLQNHQVDAVDGGSIHLSKPVLTSELGAALSERPELLRNSSAAAVVHAEGVIDPLQENGAATEGLAYRPALYDRENSNFVTAVERIGPVKNNM